MATTEIASTPAILDFSITRAGIVDYVEALAWQRSVHQSVVDQEAKNSLLLLEHPSVYTAGRRTELSERPTDGTPVIDVDRGGKITWHGEGQLVGYPIVRLKNPHDVVGFVRELEAGLIEVCAHFGVKAEQYRERSGVWIRDHCGDRKIAAIGIRVAKGVTMHGFALNVHTKLDGFNKIIPCGISDAGVTSLEREVDRKITIEEVLPIIEACLSVALRRVSQ